MNTLFLCMISRKHMAYAGGFAIFLWILWILWARYGVITIDFDGPFTVDAKGYRVVECEKNVCSLSVPFGEREFCVEKEGYVFVCQKLYIPPVRGKISWLVAAKKKPKISVVEKSLRADFSSQQHGTSDGRTIQTPLKREYFFEKETNTIFQKTKNGRKLIARFSRLTNPELFVFGENILIRDEQSVYLVRTAERQKQLLLTGTRPSISVLSNEYALIEDETTLFLFAINGDLFPQKLPFVAEAKHIAACSEKHIFFAQNGDDSTEFFRFSPKNKAVISIASAKVNAQSFSLFCAGKREIGIRTPKEDFLLSY